MGELRYLVGEARYRYQHSAEFHMKVDLTLRVLGLDKAMAINLVGPVVLLMAELDQIERCYSAGIPYSPPGWMPAEYRTQADVRRQMTKLISSPEETWDG